MIRRSDFPEFFRIRAFPLENHFTFPLFVRFGHLIDFLNAHGGHNFTIAHKCDFFTGFYFVGFFCRNIKSYRHRPKSSICQGHFFANTFPVRLSHETIQRRKTAYAHHNKVALGSRRNINFGQFFGFLLFLFKSLAFQKAADQTLAAMWGYQFGHSEIPPFKFSTVAGAFRKYSRNTLPKTGIGTKTS